MIQTPIDWAIASGIDRLFEKVWEHADRHEMSWQDVDQALQRYGLEGFDEWWKAGEE